VTPKTKKRITALAFTALTIAFGFLAWWTFAFVAFAASFYFSRREQSGLLMSTICPALGWVLVALARDLNESGRISAKLATILHVGYAPLVYVTLFVLVLIPSFFAALSGSFASKTFR
jgi:hypothetical protein